MNRLKNTFAQQKELINIFITAGYPMLNSLPTLVSQLITKGIDVIEIGMPYSDPLADGAVIQKASEQALANGMSIKLIFEQVTQIRKQHNDTPILIMGYFNQVLQVGVEKFLAKCQKAGVDGLIIPDLPYNEYSKKHQTLFEKYGIKNSFLITPQTSEARIKALDKACSAFLYIVSDNSLTGAKTEGFSSGQLAYFERIMQLKLSSPTMIGFGISTKKMVKEANKYANGAIIGSAYLESIRTNREDKFINKLTH